MKALKVIVALLLIIGGLNWGLVGLWQYNLVEALLGSVPVLVTLVYDLVGIAAVVAAVAWIMKVSKAS